MRPCAPDPFSPGSAVVQLHLVHSTVAENSKSPLKRAQAERGGDVDKGSQKIQPGKETHVALASDAEEAGRRTAGPRGSRSSERSAALSSFYLFKSNLWLYNVCTIKSTCFKRTDGRIFTNVYTPRTPHCPLVGKSDTGIRRVGFGIILTLFRNGIIILEKT